MSRVTRILLLGALMLAVAPAATSVASPLLDKNLAALWTTVLQTPGPTNPFGTGGQAFACLQLRNRTVAPFAPTGVESCSVTVGTPMFLVANSVECSTFEGTPKDSLQECARESDVQTPPGVVLDGAPVGVTAAETGLLNIVLPADNLFELPAGSQGYSYGHGWVVALVRPLTPGEHKIVITTGSTVITTIIDVRPGR